MTRMIVLIHDLWRYFLTTFCKTVGRPLLLELNEHLHIFKTGYTFCLCIQDTQSETNRYQVANHTHTHSYLLFPVFILKLQILICNLLFRSSGNHQNQQFKVYISTLPHEFCIGTGCGVTETIANIKITYHRVFN